MTPDMVLTGVLVRYPASQVERNATQNNGGLPDIVTAHFSEKKSPPTCNPTEYTEKYQAEFLRKCSVDSLMRDTNIRGQDTRTISMLRQRICPLTIRPSHSPESDDQHGPARFCGTDSLVNNSVIQLEHDQG